MLFLFVFPSLAHFLAASLSEGILIIFSSALSRVTLVNIWTTAQLHGSNSAFEHKRDQDGNFDLSSVEMMTLNQVSTPHNV